MLVVASSIFFHHPLRFRQSASLRVFRDGKKVGFASLFLLPPKQLSPVQSMGNKLHGRTKKFPSLLDSFT
uniref:Uncharacterized protein n=1 Tax=Rhizophora mucronata TaxID=61149 RepID=A0A2P2LDM0_RHIMU